MQRLDNSLLFSAKDLFYVPTSLEWVLRDGVRTPVSAFAGLKPGTRPRVTCPLCHGQLTLKLGRIRRHHAAHAAGSRCAATQPETALHINCKCHIAAVLAAAIGSGASLRVRQRCLVGNTRGDPSFDTEWVEGAADPCAEHRDTDWVTGWDDVRVEFGLGGAAARRVPDIVLMQYETVIGAIEVVVSHAVDADKAAALSTLGVPWIEVRGAEELYQGDRAWSIASPIVLEQSSAMTAWRCEAHELSYETMRDARQHVAESQARVPEMPPAVTAARLVDVYRAGGSWTRHDYAVVTSRNFGGLGRITLERDRRVVSVHLSEGDETEKAFRSRVAPLIQADYRADVARLLGHGRAFADSPMRWITGDSVRDLAAESRRYPRRFEFSTATRKWVYAPGMKGRRWPMPIDTSAAVRAVEEVVQGRRRSIHRSLEPSDRRDT